VLAAQYIFCEGCEVLWVLCKVPLPPKGLCKLQPEGKLARAIFNKAVAADGGREPWVRTEGLPRSLGLVGATSRPIQEAG